MRQGEFNQQVRLSYARRVRELWYALPGGFSAGESVELIAAVAWRPLQLDRSWLHDLRPKAAGPGSDGLWPVPARCSVFLFERTAAFPGRIGIRNHSLFRQALKKMVTKLPVSGTATAPSTTSAGPEEPVMEKSATEWVEVAKQARNEGRADDAMRAVETAIELCRGKGDTAGLITCIKALGHLEADRKDFPASAAAYLEALELARQGQDPLVIAHTVRHLGDALSRLGETRDAEAAYLEALAIYETHAGDAALDHANALGKFARLLDSP